MTIPDRPDALDWVLETLTAETNQLAAEAAENIFLELARYATVPPEAVLRSMRANVGRAVSTLRSKRPPASSTRDEAAAIAAERARQGVPIDDVIHAYRLALRAIHGRFIELADGAGVQTSIVLKCSNLLWELGDWFTVTAASEYRNHLDVAIRSTVRRTELLRQILIGSISESDIWRAAAQMNIDANGRYSTYCVSNIDGDPGPINHQRRLGTEVEIASRTFGLVTAGSQESLPTGVPIALGPPRPLHQMQGSMRVSSEIFDLVRNARPGVYRLEDLPWAVAAHSEPEVLNYLQEKYLAPLDDSGPFREVLIASLTAYLAADLNISVAAQNLFVHPNTLRYRLAKYEKVAAVRLSSTRVITELTMTIGLPLPLD